MKRFIFALSLTVLSCAHGDDCPFSGNCSSPSINLLSKDADTIDALDANDIPDAGYVGEFWWGTSPSDGGFYPDCGSPSVNDYVNCCTTQECFNQDYPDNSTIITPTWYCSTCNNKANTCLNTCQHTYPYSILDTGWCVQEYNQCVENCSNTYANCLCPFQTASLYGLDAGICNSPNFSLYE